MSKCGPVSALSTAREWIVVRRDGQIVVRTAESYMPPRPLRDPHPRCPFRPGREGRRSGIGWFRRRREENEVRREAGRQLLAGFPLTWNRRPGYATSGSIGGFRFDGGTRLMRGIGSCVRERTGDDGGDNGSVVVVLAVEEESVKGWKARRRYVWRTCGAGGSRTSFSFGSQH
jgi:hypothetical protein